MQMLLKIIRTFDHQSSWTTYIKMAEVKKPAVPSAGKGVEELEFSNTAGGKVKWYNRFEKHCNHFLKMLNIHIPI